MPLGPEVVVGINPRTGRVVSSQAASTSPEVADTIRRAADDAGFVARTGPRERGIWLRAIADALGDPTARAHVLEVAEEETALGAQRLAHEYQRLVDQLLFYADVVEDGSFLDVTIDSAALDGAGVRSMSLPRGVVGVFAASNFPFCFGVLGHDTASAIAAGCPVVVKGHPAQPRTSLLLAHIATAAIGDSAPRGLLGLIHGYAAGLQLVDSARVAAVAFTGSQSGGIALWRRAQERKVPVPVYAEMGTVNPVIVLPSALARIDEVAAGMASSMAYGAGQICTKPGVIYVPEGSEWPRALADAMNTVPRGFGLTESIARNVRDQVAHLVQSGAERLTLVPSVESAFELTPTLLRVSLGEVRRDSRILEECFGPVAVVIEYGELADVLATLSSHPGALAASVFGSPDDPDLDVGVAALAEHAGRVAVNQWPPGVAPLWSQHHGGPWPATTDPSATSVGARALHRFLRPVAFQNVPDAALPTPLQEGNPWRVPRRVDGRVLTPDPPVRS